MEILKGDKLGVLPFKDIKKISDLIFFDGPILSHFKDKYGKDILFYWVDVDENSDRWLVFQITEIQLYGYLSKHKSLKDLFDSPVNDIFYSLEIADKLEYSNIFQIFREDLNGVYIPEIESFFQSELPTIYSKKILQYQEDFLIEMSLRNAVYVKAEPKNKKNSHLVGLLDASTFLSAFGKSFESFLQFKAFKEFIDKGISDSKRIKTAIKQLLSGCPPNLLKAGISSFSIAFSPYSLSSVDEKFLNKEWREDVFKVFKDEIIDIDTKTLTEIDEIVKKLGENNTYDIYKPLVDLYNNKNIVINITDKNFVPTRAINPIKKEAAVKLINNKKVNQEDEIIDRFGLLKYHTKTKKVTAGLGSLFDQSIQPFWSTDEIKTEKVNYKLKHTLHAKYKRENGVEIIENEDLDIFATGDYISEAESDFYNQFQELYEKVGSVENTELSLQEINIKRTLIYFIKG